jgi:hypothetical protein
MPKRSSALPKPRRIAPPAPCVRTPAGASAAVERDSIVVRDPSGAIVVVYDASTGSATISAPRGDLTLQSSTGTVRISAAKDLELMAGASTRVQSERLDLAVSTAKLEAQFAELVAEALRVVSPGVSLGIGKLQLDAQRVIQHALEAYHEVEGVLETRAGRVRTLVKGATQMFSKSTSVVSEEDTFLDGRRVLLG